MYPRTRPEDGVTLIDLLVSTSIVGIIMTSLVGAIFFGIRTTADAQRGFDQSNGQQLIATYFAADVQASCDPALSLPTCTRSPNPSTSLTTACGSSAQFAMDTFSSVTSSAADQTVGYVLHGTTLQRVSCASNADSATSTTTLAHNVSSVAVSYPSSGACSGQFQLALTIAGSTLGIGTPAYDLTFCARRRAG
jgi:hypothetical protein